MTDNNSSPREFCIVSHSFARIAWPIVSHERGATCIYIYIYSWFQTGFPATISPPTVHGSFFIEDGKRRDRVGFIEEERAGTEREREERETSLESLENRSGANTCAPFTRIGTRACARRPCARSHAVVRR